MEMVSILRQCREGGDVDRSTLVLEPDGRVRIMGVLPHGSFWRPATREDAEKLATHLTGWKGVDRG